MNKAQENLYKELQKQIEIHMIKNNRRQAKDGKETYAKRCNAFAKHLAKNFGSRNFKNISDVHILSFVQERKDKVEAKTLRNELSAIRKLHSLLPKKRYDSLIENKAIDKLIGLPPVEKKEELVDRAWNYREYEKALNLAGNMGRNDVVDALRLTRHFGTRINEVTALTRQQLQESLKKGYIHIINTKNGVPRDVPIETNGAREDIERILDRNHNDRLFINHQVTHEQAKRSISKWINNHRKKFQDKNMTGTHGRMKVNCTHHGLRHMYARERFNDFKEQNMTDKQARISVSHRLGHGRDAVTKLYL